MQNHFMEGYGFKDYKYNQRYTTTIIGFLLQVYPESLTIPARTPSFNTLLREHKLPCFEILVAAELTESIDRPDVL